MAKNSIEKAYDILRSYDGTNPMIRALRHAYEKRRQPLGEFDINYILDNHDYEEFRPDKVVHITKETGEYLQEKYSLSFAPQKIKISRVVGEMGNSYHCYVKYRQSEPERLMFVKRNGIIDPLVITDWQSTEVDFSVFDKKTLALDNPRALKEHQKEGIKFLLGNKKCICADGMGLGKTTEGIVSALASGSDHILIITTASLKSTWKKECELYVDTTDINVINGSDMGDIKRINIINYDIIKNFYEVAEEPMFEKKEVYDINGVLVETLSVPVMVKNKDGRLVQKMKKSRNRDKIEEALKHSPLYLNKFDCVIIDEAQKLSNNKSIRYKSIDDFLSKAKPQYIFLLTGTPLTNNPLNLYHILKLIRADVTADYRYYIQRYCGAKEFTKKDGSKFFVFGKPQHTDELRDKIKNVYIRRLPTDIGVMVEKTIERRYYDLTTDQRKQYNKLWDDYQRAQNGDTLDLGGYDDSYWTEDEDKSDSNKHRQLIEGGLIRQFFGREMVAHTIELADELIDDGEKVVIITCYKKEMDMLKQYYGDSAVTYSGGMTTKQKDNAESDFQNDGEVKVFIGQVIACGVGLSLTASKYLIFNNYDWVAANNIQAESRIHRITSKDDVTCIYQLFNDSVSYDMFEKVLYKEQMMNAIVKSEKEK